MSEKDVNEPPGQNEGSPMPLKIFELPPPDNSLTKGPQIADLSRAIERQEINLDRQLDWIRAVDSKVPIVIGIATAMLAVTGAVSPAPANLTWQTGLLMTIGSLPLVTSLVWSVASTFPQTKGPTESNIYFGGICKMPSARYADNVTIRSDVDYLSDLSAQCYRNAQIAQAKYAAIQKAFLWLFAATPLWLMACYFLYKG